MRTLLLALLILPGAAIAQDELGGPVTFPALPEAAANAAGFAPKGWKVEETVQGDLNGDGRADLAIVLRGTDPKQIVTHDGLGTSPLDTNPRMLVAALGEGSGYRRVLENHALIPRRRDAVVDDYLHGVSVKNGIMRVKLGVWMSAGGWGTSSYDYAFRWQDGAFRMIGLDLGELQRNTGETLDFSINYLTGKVKRDAGSIEDDKPKSSRWSTIPRAPLLTIDQVGDGIEFDPWKGKDAPK